MFGTKLALFFGDNEFNRNSRTKYKFLNLNVICQQFDINKKQILKQSSLVSASLHLPATPLSPLLQSATPK